MFVGHFAVGFAGKRADPRVSLGWYVAAVTMLDLIWPVLLLAGIERASIVPGVTAFNPLSLDHYPWSHSLLMACAWGLVLAGLARWRGIAPRTAWILAALVVSHWVLDYITHAPDLPLWPGNSPKLGLGLWNSIPATFVVEGALWIGGILLYLRNRTPTRWIGPAAFWSLVVISTLMWVSGPWSAPPPDAGSLGWFALIGWIVVPWAALADKYYATDLSASSTRPSS
ncbi:MAG TPA: metal-dependent hydrolase [Gemmatimonadaceae bacterium]|nr:metal-dependent hydrolase [Gemmatimonadaceae bacterium]